MKYRKLTKEEIQALEAQMCMASDWSQIEVSEGFTTEYIKYARFSGNVKIGAFRKEFELAGGMKKHSGLYHVTLHNVVVGDDCCIENVKNYIANYRIGVSSFIENVDIILTDGVSSFGNGVEVSVLNETGGREVMIYDRLSAHQAYIMALYRHRPELIRKMREIVSNYAASDSLFFSNCHGENGEACAIFAGPFTVTHHKSTLLIAGMFSFMNAGSGSNQSNHMYKLGPIHQGIMERGAKTASDSYLLWPAKVGAFSLVMGRHVTHQDTSDLPFSYLIEKQNTSYIFPGVNLRSVGTIRDAKKWPTRDGRKDPEKLDCVNFNLLSPYTIQKMISSIKILENLVAASGETSDTYSYQSAKIKNSSLKKGLNFYRIAIDKFMGNSLIKRLETVPRGDVEAIRARMKPDTQVGRGPWVDLAGLIAPKSLTDELLDKIETGQIVDAEEINLAFANAHSNYYTYEWTWVYDRFKDYYGIDPEQITVDQVISLARRWKESVVSLDEMVYEDAKKEFSLSSMTSFGADGDRMQQNLDFEEVRGGDFASNPFVNAILDHIKSRSALGDEFIERMSR